MAKANAKKTVTIGELVPSAEALSREQERLASTPWSPGMPITDKIITPFVLALIADGLTIKKRNMGCDDLSRCPICNNGYVITTVLNDIESKHCPHCRRAADQAAHRNPTS